MKTLRREHAQLQAALGELGFWGAVADAGDQAELEEQAEGDEAGRQAELEVPAEGDNAGRQAELEVPAEGGDTGRQSGSAARSQEELVSAESDAKQTNQSAPTSRCVACMLHCLN